MEKELKCRSCNRHLGISKGTTIAELICPSCKATTQFKVINGDATQDLLFKWTTAPKEPKKKEGE